MSSTWWANSRRDALIEAGRVRLRPILMTTIALIAGMIPVALGLGEGADFRAPLGRAGIGGVITSTVLTLLVIPTVYEIVVEWRETIRGLFRRKKKPGGGAAGGGAGGGGAALRQASPLLALPATALASEPLSFMTTLP